MTDNLFIAKRAMRMGGVQVDIGEIVSPKGSRNDPKMFGDNTHWLVRYLPVTGNEPLLCDTDGCNRRFATLGALQRHRDLVHRPEREDVERFRRERAEVKAKHEETGETIGGYEVTRKVKTQHGEVPYIDLK